jgi:hypothetical protein
MQQVVSGESSGSGTLHLLDVTVRGVAPQPSLFPVTPRLPLHLEISNVLLST